MGDISACGFESALDKEILTSVQQSGFAVKDIEAFPDGTDFSIGHKRLAPPLIIFTAGAKFKWSIKCTN